MKLVYDVIEDVYDDTTQIRTTLYTPHNISMDITHIRGKKNRKSLFKALR